MRVHIQVLFLGMMAFGLFGCKKINQVDNSGTVKSPYVLYVGGYYGTLHKTNDALYFNTLFPTDHSTVRQVLAADTMLLYLKENFYFSRNEGGAFKESNNHTNLFQDLFYKYYIPNQAVYDKIDKTVYLCCASGLEKSTDNGVIFNAETNWSAIPAPVVFPTSITQTDDGNLYMIQDSANIYSKQVGAAWTKVTQNTKLPTDTTTWYFTHKQNTLFAIDYYGMSGIWYSNNGGVDWTTCTGIPKSKKILFGNETQSLNGTFFAGRDSGGLYRLDATGTNFVTSGAGIPWYAKVHFVVGKKLIYRTDKVRYYHFCATDIGLYVSENDGIDWRLLRAGSYSTLY